MKTPPPLPPPRHGAVPPKLPQISKPPRRATTLQKVFWLSAAGLVLLVTGFFGLRAYQFSQWLKHRQPSGVDFFREASENVGAQGVTASGNSELAKDMAADMSRLMLTIRTIGFEQAKEKSVLDNRDQFRTYCDLRSNQCVFLIHIPELRRFTEHAQDSLASEAWKSAQAVLARREAGIGGMKLAIGMVGLVSYERVMLGRYFPESNRVDPAPEKVLRGFGCERTLYDWFTPVTNNLQPRATSP